MNEQIYMQRCLQLALNAQGRTFPNPLVGSVIVHDGKIIGEGFHKRAGEPHAEVMAINSVRDKSLLKHSTLYVNLEPCSHYGKTPPCADLIIKWQIPRVVIATKDTSAKVSGRGIEKLKSAGIDVTVGVLEKQARWLNRRFFTFHEKKRPYVILKWAQTADGFIDPLRQSKERRSIAISSKFAHSLVHKWRAAENSILVGTNTVINDDPQLTVRQWFGQNPVRICIDDKSRIPKDSKIFDSQAPTICLKDAKYKDIELLLDYLYRKNIQSVMVEGGAMVLNEFLRKNIWDEIRIFFVKSLFLHGLKAPQVENGRIVFSAQLANEFLFVILPEHETYFTDIPFNDLNFL